MRLRLAIVLATLSVIGAAYLAWSLHRLSDVVLVADGRWPRPWPYPDRWLAALNDRYDARYPAPPDTLKIHGELPRVRGTVGLAFATCLLGSAAAVGMRVGGPVRPRRRDA